MPLNGKVYLLDSAWDRKGRSLSCFCKCDVSSFPTGQGLVKAYIYEKQNYLIYHAKLVCQQIQTTPQKN